MQIPNAVKVCCETESYIYCEHCPIYSVCCADYSNTEEFEIALENAAIEYLKGRKEK